MLEHLFCHYASNRFHSVVVEIDVFKRRRTGSTPGVVAAFRSRARSLYAGTLAAVV